MSARHLENTVVIPPNYSKAYPMKGNTIIGLPSTGCLTLIMCGIGSRVQCMTGIPRTYFSYNDGDDKHKDNSYNDNNSNNSNNNDSKNNNNNKYNNDYDGCDDHDDDYDDEDEDRKNDGYNYNNGTTMAMKMIWSWKGP